MKGSLTIEASFIYPLVILLTCFTIMYCFYCHDKVSTKANAYTSMIKSYFSEEKSYDQSTFTSSLDDICLLVNDYACSYNKNSKKLSITDTYGHSYTVSFSAIERCDYIRSNYCLIKTILLKNK